MGPAGPVSPLGPGWPFVIVAVVVPSLSVIVMVCEPSLLVATFAETLVPVPSVVFFTLEPTKIKSPLESVRFSAYKPSPKSIRKPLARKFSTTLLPIAGDVVAPSVAFAPPL